MFYRRKIILSLIELFEGYLDKLRLQKLLFLFSKRKSGKPEYDFIPYKYGCYSYSANADLGAMIKRGFLTIKDDKTYFKNDDVNYLDTLKKTDVIILKEVVNTYGKMSTNALIKHTYINFPFYAIKSDIAKKLLNDTFYQKVVNAIPKENETTLFTIGYQGVSLEKYLKKLVENNVKLLVDVRKNPLSMKYGFSKTLLKKFCNSLGIEYIHIPNVGIISDKRRELKTQKDYDVLFDDYKTTTLKANIESQNEILELLKHHKRIALTCFEANICQCHRLHLANSLEEFKEFEFITKHI